MPKTSVQGEQQINPAIKEKLTKNSQIFPDIKRKRVKKVLQQKKKLKKSYKSFIFVFLAKYHIEEKKKKKEVEEKKHMLSSIIIDCIERSINQLRQ